MHVACHAYHMHEGHGHMHICQGGVHVESIWVILNQQDVLELNYIASSYLCHG